MTAWPLFQALSFNIVWFLCVLEKNQLLLVALLVLLIQLLATPTKTADLRVLPLALIGFSADMVFTQFDLLRFQDTPYWLLIIWLGFVLTLGHSLTFLHRLNWPLISALGAGAGCYCYLVSWRLGALELPHGPFASALVIACWWALLLPALVAFDQKIRAPRLVEDG